jgi:hypothetical protein
MGQDVFVTLNGRVCVAHWLVQQLPGLRDCPLQCHSLQNNPLLLLFLLSYVVGLICFRGFGGKSLSRLERWCLLVLTFQDWDCGYMAVEMSKLEV